MTNLFLTSLLDKFPILELPGKPFKGLTSSWTSVRLPGFETLKLSSQIPVTLQNRDMAANKDCGRNSALRSFRVEQVNSKRLLSPQCRMWESTQAWGALQKSSQVWEASLKHFQKFRMLSAMQEGLSQPVVKWRPLVPRKSKNHWQNAGFPSLFMRFALDCWKCSRHNCAGRGVNLQHRKGLCILNATGDEAGLFALLLPILSLSRKTQACHYLLAWLMCKNPFLNSCVWEETVGWYFKCWGLGRLFCGYQKQSE